MKLRVFFVSLFSAAAVVLTFFPFRVPFYRDVYNNVVLDNYDHWLTCSELPTLEQIEAIMTRNEDALEQIRAVDSAGRPSVQLEVDRSTCEGRGDLIIWYGGHAHREQIEEILGDHTFFGVPVRLRNF